MEHLRFPIGHFHAPEMIIPSDIEQWIEDIEKFPMLLTEELIGLSQEQLEWSYRPDGWSIRQLTHHCADSHMNSFIRFKLALTEDKPVIKPYEEALWAKLPDNESDVTESLFILKGLHARWVQLLKNLSYKDLDREFVHPENGQTVSVAENIGIYAWHGKHHLEHIRLAKGFKGDMAKALEIL
ncbi:putative metal-dependent hydrolase [Fulvitalea axinellae]|uniref:Metal-dependent hydrolase n=1 Tax=Fulvitalea axinellae TaxID=1182444 RepID=A0AAU9CTE6_9BACT|nr:putative metal-dependent hydrolase [Fulvitalea axinellae]